MGCDSKVQSPLPSLALRASGAAAKPLPPDRFYHATLLGLSIGVLLLSFVLAIRNRTQVVLPLAGIPLPELCTMRRFIGLPCPGCGLTRCFISLAHGEVRGAWSYNPAGFLLFAMIALQIPYRAIQLYRISRQQAEIQLPLVGPILFGVLGIALVAQWSLRLAGVSF